MLMKVRKVQPMLKGFDDVNHTLSVIVLEVVLCVSGVGLQCQTPVNRPCFAVLLYSVIRILCDSVAK